MDVLKNHRVSIALFASCCSEFRGRDCGGTHPGFPGTYHANQVAQTALVKIQTSDSGILSPGNGSRLSRPSLTRPPSVPSSPSSMSHDTANSDLNFLEQRLSPSISRSRVSAGSAGFADGTSSYQNNTALHIDDTEEDVDDESLTDFNQQGVGVNRKSFLQRLKGGVNKKQQKQQEKSLTPEEADEYMVGGKNNAVASLIPLVTGTMPSSINDSTIFDNDDVEDSKQRSRIHAKHSGEDGSTNYQNETMGHYTVDNMDEDDNEEELIRSSSPSASEADSRKRRMRMSLSQVVFGSKNRDSASKKPPMSPRQLASPKSPASRTSLVSSPHSVNSSQHSGSASKQLISDLLWLEQKIAATNQASSPPPYEESPSSRHRGAISPSDSLSFASRDDGQTMSDDNNHSSRSEVDRTSDPSSESSVDTRNINLNQSIICRDCYAPPGKLKIVIHSTKDGPAVHTVKKGSSLEGHIFPGDLIISVDNVDTRTYSAEQVMKMMTAKTRFERKITVLHFEDDMTTSGAESS